MEKLHFLASEYTPQVYFEPELNIYLIEGFSFPNDPIKFYNPIFEWLKDFLEVFDNSTKIDFNFKLNYFNTSSSKQIAKFFKMIEASESKKNIVVNWFYDEEDLDMLDAGYRFEKLIKINFDFRKN
ncbi:MAG: DUF1987 domain-containing protein [Bacteroidales bacterium]|nr:DUF1987 domain-containing protein [Bacteroidales bacterium]